MPAVSSGSSSDKEIVTLLSEESRELDAFVTLLRQEQSLLEAGEVDVLPELAEKKAILADRLTVLAARREQALAAAGLGSGREAMSRWLSAGADKDPIRQRWTQFIDRIAEARTLNEINGKMIGMRMQHNQQALAVLLAAADRLATYGPDGQQKTGGTGRSLGSA